MLNADIMVPRLNIAIAARSGSEHSSICGGMLHQNFGQVQKFVLLRSIRENISSFARVSSVG